MKNWMPNCLLINSKEFGIQMLKNLEFREGAFRNLKYYFLNAAVFVFGQAISFFKSGMCEFFAKPMIKNKCLPHNSWEIHK